VRKLEERNWTKTAYNTNAYAYTSALCQHTDNDVVWSCIEHWAY